MKKYLTMFSSHLKSALVYRADAWLTAAFSLFTVLAFYFLWSLLIPDGGTLHGFTLPEMMTYTLLCQMFAPVAQSSEAMWVFSDEIRSGKFSKYMYTPVSPLGAFTACSLGKTLPQAASTVVCCLVWGLLLGGIMSPVSVTGILTALPVLLVSLAFIVLLNYLLSCLAFRFTDLTGVILIRGTLISFFSGALAPLEVLFGSSPTWSPLYYLADYPAMCIMGKAPVPPLTAVLVIGGYTLALALISGKISSSSRRLYEGVGA